MPSFNSETFALYDVAEADLDYEQAVMDIVLTPLGEREFIPDYGTLVHRAFLLSPPQIYESINSAVLRFDPRTVRTEERRTEATLFVDVYGATVLTISV